MMNAAQSNAGIASMGPMLAKMGRYEDTQVAHVAPGEVVVPRQLMESNPELRQEVMNAFDEVGVDPAQFIVGGDVVMKNPVTGIQEFGLWGKLKKAVKKLAPILVPLALSFTPLAALGNTAFGAISGGLTGIVQGGRPEDVLKSAVTGGAIGGLTSLGQKLRAPGPDIDLGTATKATAPADNLVKELSTAGSPTVDLATFDIPGVIKPRASLLSPEQQAQLSLDKLSTSLDSGQLISNRQLNAVTSGIPSAAGPAQNVSLGMTSTIPSAGSPAQNLSLGMSGQDAIQAAHSNATPFPEELGPRGYGVSQAGDNALAQGIQTMAGKFAEPFMPGTFNPLKAAGYTSIAGSMFVEEPKEEEFDSEAAYQAAMAEYERQVQALGYKPAPLNFAAGGVADMMNGGFTQGPGTGTSDSIPAYLSDGEFVMTAKAVEGAGNGNPKQGAAKMYAMMDKFERMA